MPFSRESARRALRILGAFFLTVVSVQAQALGLGRLVVHSNLDEPLNGQIELIAPKDHEIKTLKATLAAREEFDIAGIERAAHLFDIKYDVSHSPKGQYYIKVTTDRAVREPFLHFLVQVEWSGGKLIREYSVLLDPPQWVAGRPAEIDTPHETVIGEVPPAAPVAAAPLETPAAPAPEPVTSAAAAPVETLPPLEELPPLTDDKPVVAAAPAPVEQPAAAPAPTPAPFAEAQPVAPVAEPREPVAAMPAETAVAQAPMPAPQPVGTPAPSLAGQEYGPVRTGETLSQITDKLNYDKSLTSQQAMMAILRANPSAFIDNNVNNLKVGKILRVPEHETVAAIPRDQAAREFRGQYDAWQEYKLKLAGASRPIDVAAVEKPKTAPALAPEKTKAGKKAAAEKPAAKGKAEPVDLLRIVRANLDREIPEDSAKTPGVDPSKDAGKEKKALTDRIATLEEAMESSKMQNKESRDRVGKLQEQAKNTERLIELENKELAKAQKQAAEKQAAEAKVAAEKAAAEKAAADKAAAEAKAAAAKLAQEKATAKPAEEKKPAPTAATPAVKKPVVTPPPPVEESFIDSMIAIASDNAMNLGAAMLIFVLGGGGLYAYRRHRASREFSESILSNSSLSAEASIISDSTGQAAASDTSFLSDFSQGGMGNVHTDEVDPIAEAEVYLAYGRDEQAEEILKDAIVKDPARQELKGKLLEIYFQRNDVSAFETLAEELYAAIEGRGGKVWDKAEEMGRKLSPNNPMFRGGKPAARPDANTTLLVNQALDTGLPGGSDTRDMMAVTSSDLGMASTQGNESSPGLDFSMNFDEAPAAKPDSASLDMPLDMTTTMETTPASSGFDMDFNLGDSAAADTSSNVVDFALPESTEPSTGHIDFDMPSAGNDTTIEFNVGSPGDATLEFPATSAGANGNGDNGLPGWDETATKLDLAKAYIDMGDSEGARSILDEVIQEGNDTQKQQARDLASQIAA